MQIKHCSYTLTCGKRILTVEASTDLEMTMIYLYWHDNCLQLIISSGWQKFANHWVSLFLAVDSEAFLYARIKISDSLHFVIHAGVIDGEELLPQVKGVAWTRKEAVWECSHSHHSFSSADISSTFDRPWVLVNSSCWSGSLFTRDKNSSDRRTSFEKSNPR